MGAVLRREPHVEQEPPSIREALATVQNECARRRGESHISKTGDHQPVKLLHRLRTNVCGAKARATFRKRVILNP
eukprot:5302943-Pyramimonas_sp.AAC.1